MDFIDKYFSNGLTLIVITLLVLVIAYRYYSAFLAAKVLALDPLRPTPAHRLNDGQNYYPTNKWVLFGHHFAAIAGAGPLIGPVLAAQFGYLPGFLWILIGVCLAGAVQDFTILVLSTRHNGKSLAQLAFHEIGPVAGTAATIGILFVLVIALAGLGKVVTKALGGEVIRYPAGTRFVSPVIPNPDTRPDPRHVRPKTVNAVIFAGIMQSTPPRWRIPEGAEIHYPKAHPDDPEAVEIVGARFDIEATFDPASPAATRPGVPDLDAHIARPDGSFLPGDGLVIPNDIIAIRRIDGSTWGTFTIALTIPIALFVGFYIYRFRKGKILEASIIGGLLTLGAVYLGGMLDGTTAYAEGGLLATISSYLATFRDYFNLSEHQVGIAMAIYGFIAAILPVWVLLCPRDYLSSFLKIGTVILLVIGIIFAHPHLYARPINMSFINGGPAFNGAMFPFLFIVIMCGAVSGFHALVSSGTTPKMINKETDARAIGYGAMLVEGLVGILALIAACALPSAQYYHIQTSISSIPTWAPQISDMVKQETAEHDAQRKLAGLPEEKMRQPEEVALMVGENLQGRTGGAVTLAVGMAQILDDAAKNILGAGKGAMDKLAGLFKYWYHFAIMFEALFILTTIDTGTRVGRFLLQESLGKWVHPKFAQTNWLPGAILTTAIIVGAWWYFLEANAMQAIWPMFGIANQMLAAMALAIATVGIIQLGKKKYAWVTLAPLCFVIFTTTIAAVIMTRRNFITALDGAQSSAGRTNALIGAICVLVIVLCTFVVVVNALLASGRPPRPNAAGDEPAAATVTPIAAAPVPPPVEGT